MAHQGLMLMSPFEKAYWPLNYIHSESEDLACVFSVKYQILM